MHFHVQPRERGAFLPVPSPLHLHPSNAFTERCYAFTERWRCLERLWNDKHARLHFCSQHRWRGSLPPSSNALDPPYPHPHRIAT